MSGIAEDHADNYDLLLRAVDHARNGIIVTDHRQPDNPIIYANAAFEALTGYTQAELLGRNCRFLQGPATDPRARNALRDAVHRGVALRIELQNYRKDGTVFWNDLLISPIRNTHGVVTHFIGNQLDVTARKAAEAALRAERTRLAHRVQERTAQLHAQREYLASIVETIREPLLVLDSTLRIQVANRAFYTTFAAQASETEGAFLYELGNGQWNIPRLRALLEDILPHQLAMHDVVVEHTFPDIGHRTMLLNARQITLRGSHQPRILLAIEDVSARKSAEAATRREIVLTDAVLGSINAHIAVIDRHGIIIAVNDAWRQFAQQNGSCLEQDAVVGVSYLAVLQRASLGQVNHAQQSLAGITAVLGGTQTQFAWEYACHTAAGETWFLLQVTPLKHPDGGAVISHIDMTARKQMELRKDEFIRIASHELKTPLTSLKIMAQLMQRGMLRDGLPTFLPQVQKMHVQIDRLTRLVHELLDVSRIDAGKLVFQREQVDLRALVHSVIDRFRVTVPDRVMTIEGTGTPTVDADPDRIEQVLLNLLTNAVTYSPERSPIIVRIVVDQAHVTVSVTDAGVGIDHQHYDEIFTRFYQVIDARAKTSPGLGMGLYIAKHIIQEHQGELWVESRKGVGSTFSFTLPLAR